MVNFLMLVDILILCTVYCITYFSVAELFRVDLRNLIAENRHSIRKRGKSR